MKLKKIASLALAGIMAVSMLAGCGEAASSEPTNPVTPVTGAAAYANENLGNLDGDIEFSDASWLNSKLNDIATNAGNFAAGDASTAYSIAWAYANATSAYQHTTMDGKLDDYMTENGYVLVTSFATTGTNTNTNTWNGVYVVSGKLDEESAIKAVMSTVNSALRPATTTDYMPATTTINGAVYNCEYTGEISALRVTNSSLSGESAWAVAVVINRNVEKSANTQV